MSAVEEASSAAAKAAPKAKVARRVPATSRSLALCGARLRSGELVSFPTETVYGLGCHALDPAAARKVFAAKERPLSDPLIVHVSRVEDALELWEASSPAAEGSERSDGRRRRRREVERRALTALSSAFFPGPLTLVARARPSVPSVLMAGTGYVACRAPSHPVARALIDAAGVPIAAPSANKFGHVSPTKAEHVMDDLGGEDVWVVDPSMEGGAAQDPGPDSGAVCEVGVESTVAKVEMNHGAELDAMGSITILRHGAVSSQSMREVLEKEDLSRHFVVSDSIQFNSEKIHNVAPGQTVKHYSPRVPCFMIAVGRQSPCRSEGLGSEELSVLSKSVIVDYGARLAHHRSRALAYRDLSPEGDPTAAAARLFETLRWTEAIEGAERVFVPELVWEAGESDGKNDGDAEKNGALVLAVKDKLTRAASAVVVDEFR
ncbi:hypothetical protein ACHAWF_002892 [Thalassiosira exigua]